jgi:hypothetical protein
MGPDGRTARVEASVPVITGGYVVGGGASLPPVCSEAGGEGRETKDCHHALRCVKGRRTLRRGLGEEPATVGRGGRFWTLDNGSSRQGTQERAPCTVQHLQIQSLLLQEQEHT